MYFSFLLQVACLFLYAVRGEAMDISVTDAAQQKVVLYDMHHYSLFVKKQKTGDWADILFPDKQTIRIFVERTFQEYKDKCAKEGKPTRLVVGCGHGKSPDGDGICPGHDADYFTVNLTYERYPDMLGDVFFMESLIFQTNSWDFIIFECCANWGENFNEKNLRMIANSLRLDGVWICPEYKSRLPRIIKIGADYCYGGDLASKIPEESFRGNLLMREICIKKGKMKNLEECRKFSHDINYGDYAEFSNFDDVKTTVNQYFIDLGFKSTEIITHPSLFLRDDPWQGMTEIPAKLELENMDTGVIQVLDLSKLKFSRLTADAVSPLTGEKVYIDTNQPSKRSFGHEVDALVGDAFLALPYSDLLEYSFVVRGRGTEISYFESFFASVSRFFK